SSPSTASSGGAVSSSTRRQAARRPAELAALAAAGLLLLVPAAAVAAQSLGLPGVEIRIDAAKAKPSEVATALKILAVLTALTLAPAALVGTTAFTRIIVGLAMLRMALGM